MSNAAAVSDDGTVFVARMNQSAIGVIDPSGTTIATVFTAFPPAAVAVSPDGSALFAANWFWAIGFNVGPSVMKFTSDGAPTPTYTEDPAWAPDPAVFTFARFGFTVDRSSGDLLVGAAGGTYRFDATSGALISSFDGSTADRGPFAPEGLASTPDGDIYAIVGAGRVEHMGADGAWKGELKVPDPGGNVSPTGIAVNPQNGDVAVELLQSGENVIKIYTATHDLKDTIRVPPAVGSGKGLAFAPDGSKLYSAADNGSAHVYELGTRPGVDPPMASEITTTGARLSAAVATAGDATTARIEYCLATDPCSKFLSSEIDSPESPWHALPDHTGLESEPGEDTIVDDVAGLAPNTKYLTRTYAINEESQVEGRSATGSFTTAVVPPVVQTGAATGVTDTAADLSGTIDAIGAQTTYHFEYGPTASYGSTAPAGAEAIAGAERTPRTFTQTIKGLQAGTTYHYRLVATNSAGTALGEDRTFTTLGAGETAPRRGYELVTATDKKGLVPFANFGFQAAADGSAFVYSAAGASSEAESAAQASRYLSRRSASGWTGQTPLDPPLGPTRAILNVVTQAVSGDLQHTLVISQRALTPDAVEGAANIYVNDVESGAYHLLGSDTASGAFAGLTGPNTSNTFIAGAPDFSWVVLMGHHPLLPGAPERAMYKWTKAAGLSLISLLPGDVVPTGSAWVQTNVQTTNRLVSDDGDTVAFSLTNGEGGVYRRSAGETEAVSVSKVSGDPSGARPGTVAGMSRDGRYVFFFSGVRLTDSAPGSGLMLYRYDSSSGELEYIDTIVGNRDGSLDILGIGDDGRTVYFNRASPDVVAWRDGQLDVVAPAQQLTAGNYGYPSPNGRYLAFSLDGVIHLYDAVAGEETCLSCLPGGVSATGRIGGAPERNLSNRYPQVVTDDGHAYFDADSPLMSADRNGTSDVYEYFKGRLTLVSPGARDFAAILSDISLDGSTVFFTTAEGLVKRDIDRSTDVYAARVGGGFPEAPSQPECAGEACRDGGGASLPAPNIGSKTAGRSTPSRPVRCRKGTHRVRKGGKARCMKNHHKKKRATKQNRGAGR